jgi:hypothetical protein
MRKLRTSTENQKFSAKKRSDVIEFEKDALLAERDLKISSTQWLFMKNNWRSS